MAGSCALRNAYCNSRECITVHGRFVKPTAVCPPGSILVCLVLVRRKATTYSSSLFIDDDVYTSSSSRCAGNQLLAFNGQVAKPPLSMLRLARSCSTSFPMRKSVFNLQGGRAQKGSLKPWGLVFLASWICGWPWNGFAVAASSSAPGRMVSDDVRNGLALAKSYYQQEQYSQAEDELRRLLLQVPKDYSTNELLGLVLSAENRDADATPFLEQAVHANPSEISARENLAANYAKRNLTTLAERELTTLVKLDENNFDLEHNLGEFFIRQGKIAKAIPPLRLAQELKPTDYTNGYDLSLAEIMVGQLADAAKQIKTLLLVKDTAELHSLLAEIYEKQNKFLLAGVEFQRAVAIDPTEETILEWGVELLRHKNLKESAEVFGSGVARYPQSWRMNIGLGVSQSLLGHSQEAVAATLHAVDLDPDNPRSYFFLARLDPIPAAQSSDVSERFESYARKHPNRAEAQLYYANDLWRADEASNQSTHLEDIQSLLKKAVSIDPLLAEPHLRLGIIHARSEHYAAAANDFEEAIRQDPNLAVAHYRLALALMRLGQHERAQRELEVFRRLESAQKRPDVVTAFLLTK